ncbi:hypothetical protein RFI_17235, partial [Reticulomyxa filosa]
MTDLSTKFLKYLSKEEITLFQGRIAKLQNNRDAICQIIYEELSTYLQVSQRNDTFYELSTYKILAFLSEFRKNYDINYQYQGEKFPLEKSYTLLHKCVLLNHVILVRFLLLLFKECQVDIAISNPENSYLDKKNALDLAVFNCNAQIISAIQAFKVEQRRAKGYTTTWNRDAKNLMEEYDLMSSKSELFIEALHQATKGDESKVDMVLETLQETMKILIQ